MTRDEPGKPADRCSNHWRNLIWHDCRGGGLGGIERPWRSWKWRRRRLEIKRSRTTGRRRFQGLLYDLRRRHRLLGPAENDFHWHYRRSFKMCAPERAP